MEKNISLKSRISFFIKKKQKLIFLISLMKVMILKILLQDRSQYLFVLF